ncbi:MAG: DNA polymerase III subunit [Planctomycetota bacterium]|jgi:DNA polymerase-3 subunit delta'
MPLKDIYCQDKAIGFLQRSFAAGKPAHAYIFAGDEGVGKFMAAKQWAKMLLCENPVTENNFADSCGSCQPCRLLEADSHPDFSHIYKELLEFTQDGKGKTTPVDLAVDVIREFLIDKVSAKPTLSERKVFVISEAERLNASSQNAMLKALEEPPEYCTIILICTRTEKLLPTIKSRTQTLRFGPIEENIIVQKLEELGLSKKLAQCFARLAQGSLGRAAQWAQLELAGAELYETKKQLLSYLANLQYPDTLETAQWLLEQSKNIAANWAELEKNTSKTDINRRAQKILIWMTISALYDAMRLNLTQPEKIINLDQKPQIKALAKRFGPPLAAQKISDCYQTIRWIESSVNEKLVFDQLLLNLADSDTMKV